VVRIDEVVAPAPLQMLILDVLRRSINLSDRMRMTTGTMRNRGGLTFQKFTFGRMSRLFEIQCAALSIDDRPNQFWRMLAKDRQSKLVAPTRQALDPRLRHWRKVGWIVLGFSTAH